MTNIVKCWNLGRVFYKMSNDLQKNISKQHTYQDLRVTIENAVKSAQSSTQNTLLVMEHEPVYTTGLRNYLKPEDEIKLMSNGAQYFRADRGGLITFHGPGQLTAYPILNLRHFKPSAKWYVCRLEECIIETCKRIGITADRSSHTGIWVGDNKICALGIHISRGTTTHGLGLNCSTDLKWFDEITPCGIEGKGVTSITKELNMYTSINDVLPVFYQSFEDVFKCKLIPFPDEQKLSILDS